MVARQGSRLRELIRERYQGLTANQRKVADYLLSHSGEAPFLSIVELERRSGASKATIVRLAQRLGFSGFLTMREEWGRELQMLVTGAGLPRIADFNGRRDPLAAVARQELRNINQTLDQIDRRVFDDVIRMILKADHVYTAGLGISALLARICAYSLSQVAIHASAFAHDHATFHEQVPFLSGRDLLMVFSFPPYSRETIDCAVAAVERGIPLVAITDRVTSPSALRATRTLPVRSANLLYTNSFSAIAVIINALVTSVALRRKARATSLQREIERALRTTGHYSPE